MANVVEEKTFVESSERILRTNRQNEQNKAVEIETGIQRNNLLSNILLCNKNTKELQTLHDKNDISSNRSEGNFCRKKKKMTMKEELLKEVKW